MLLCSIEYEAIIVEDARGLLLRFVTVFGPEVLHPNNRAILPLTCTDSPERIHVILIGSLGLPRPSVETVFQEDVEVDANSEVSLEDLFNDARLLLSPKSAHLQDSVDILHAAFVLGYVEGDLNGRTRADILFLNVEYVAADLHIVRVLFNLPMSNQFLGFNHEVPRASLFLLLFVDGATVVNASFALQLNARGALASCLAALDLLVERVGLDGRIRALGLEWRKD